MTNDDIKRKAAELVKAGDVAGLRRLMEYIKGCIATVASQSNWMRNRQAKLLVQQEQQRHVESLKIKKMDDEITQFQVAISELAPTLANLEKVSKTEIEKRKAKVVEERAKKDRERAAKLRALEQVKRKPAKTIVPVPAPPQKPPAVKK